MRTCNLCEAQASQCTLLLLVGMVRVFIHGKHIAKFRTQGIKDSSFPKRSYAWSTGGATNSSLFPQGSWPKNRLFSVGRSLPGSLMLEIAPSIGVTSNPLLSMWAFRLARASRLVTLNAGWAFFAGMNGYASTRQGVRSHIAHCC